MADEPKDLLSTTDAMVWAQEFCRTFDGWIVRMNVWDDHQGEINDGTMVTWFANAIMTGRQEGAQSHCPHTARFDITEDLECCRKCGKLFGEDDDHDD